MHYIVQMLTEKFWNFRLNETFNAIQKNSSSSPFIQRKTNKATFLEGDLSRIVSRFMFRRQHFNFSFVRETSEIPCLKHFSRLERGFLKRPYISVIYSNVERAKYSPSNPCSGNFPNNLFIFLYISRNWTVQRCETPDRFSNKKINMLKWNFAIPFRIYFDNKLFSK